MPVITALKVQKRRPSVNIYIDGSYYCSLSLDEVVLKGYRKGQSITLEELSLVKDQSLYDYLYRSVQNFLSFRPRSHREISDYLKRKAAKKDPATIDHQPVISRLLAKLSTLDLINDSAFAAWFISQRLTHRPKGPIALISELVKKGVPLPLAKASVSASLSSSTQLELLARDALSRKSAWQKLPPEEYRRKAMAFLSRRGFSYDTIRRVVDRQEDRE